MMQLCGTSTEQRRMLTEMAASGVKPDVATYTMLTKQLMVEGKAEEARGVVETEMAAAGVVPNDRTRAVFKRRDNEWSKHRTSKHIIE